LSQAEGNSSTTAFNFVVTLSNPSSQTITVLYSTADGTATLGNNDYNQVSNVMITFNPGVTTQNATVQVVGDTTSEPNETFFVNLGSAVNASILDNQAQGTIQNDDGPQVTNANPSNGSTGWNPGTHLVLTFSMAMDPATFTTTGVGKTVQVSPDPSGGAVASPMILFWDGTNTILTITFDTKLPVGVFGDDVLADNTPYTVTVVGGGSGVKSSVGTGSLAMSGNYTTTFTTKADSVGPTVVSFNPDLNQPFAGDRRRDDPDHVQRAHAEDPGRRADQAGDEGLQNQLDDRRIEHRHDLVLERTRDDSDGHEHHRPAARRSLSVELEQLQRLERELLQRQRSDHHFRAPGLRYDGPPGHGDGSPRQRRRTP
jgi:hypothetical protein